MIEWISVKSKLPPVGESVLVCMMCDMQNDGSFLKKVSIEYIIKSNKRYFSEDFTHWAFINYPEITTTHKRRLSRNLHSRMIEKRDELERMEVERQNKLKKMSTPEYKEALKSAFDYQDELDRKAALKRAAKAEAKQ